MVTKLFRITITEEDYYKQVKDLAADLSSVNMDDIFGNKVPNSGTIEQHLHMCYDYVVKNFSFENYVNGVLNKWWSDDKIKIYLIAINPDSEIKINFIKKGYSGRTFIITVIYDIFSKKGKQI